MHIAQHDAGSPKALLAQNLVASGGDFDAAVLRIHVIRAGVRCPELVTIAHAVQSRACLIPGPGQQPICDGSMLGRVRCLSAAKISSASAPPPDRRNRSVS